MAIYFDNAATSQKPQVVIDSIVNYYTTINSNIHRGVHTLSQESTTAFEQAREKIQTHFNAKYSHEIIFTSGTTHSINIVASGFTSILNKEDRKLYNIEKLVKDTNNFTMAHLKETFISLYILKNPYEDTLKRLKKSKITDERMGFSISED